VAQTALARHGEREALENRKLYEIERGARTYAEEAARAREDAIPVVVVSATVKPNTPKPVLRAKAFWSKPPDADRISKVHLYCTIHRHS
jgi:hypothetical protein